MKRWMDEEMKRWGMEIAREDGEIYEEMERLEMEMWQEREIERRTGEMGRSRDGKKERRSVEEIKTDIHMVHSC